MLQNQRVDTAAAALQAERAERASLADRLGVVVRERDASRHDADALRVELAAHISSHDSEIQVWQIDIVHLPGLVAVASTHRTVTLDCASWTECACDACDVSISGSI